MTRILAGLACLLGAIALACGITAAQAAAAAPGLVAAYGFDEGFGTAVADASGTGNAGTASATTWTPPAATAAPVVQRHGAT